jgi:crossover junction endodeoxyribonuclease RuvC
MIAPTQVLGIDPGSRRTGYAFASFRGDEVVALECGTWIVRDGLSRAAGLACLAHAAEAWLASRRPAAAAVESLFQHRNVRSALVLAEARGVLLAVLGGLEIPVFEYPPATVKRTICGSGAADKEQVRRALLMTVRGLRQFPIEANGLDASDAVALAVTHRAVARVTV